MAGTYVVDLKNVERSKVEVENLEILEKSSKHSLVSLPHCTV